MAVTAAPKKTGPSMHPAKSIDELGPGQWMHLLCVPLVLMLILFSPSVLAAEGGEGSAPAAPFKLTGAALKEGAVSLDKTAWLYRLGHDPGWAAQELDETAWK